jgi:hypothetical protein
MPRLAIKAIAICRTALLVSLISRAKVLGKREDDLRWHLFYDPERGRIRPPSTSVPSTTATRSCGRDPRVKEPKVERPLEVW